MEWWVFPALVLCAVTFTAAAGVLVFLAARGVWRLLARYEPAHAAGPAGPVGERWVPWEDDPRVGSMQLADDVAVGGWEYRSTSGVSYPVALPPLDWREVAHEGDWRAQTAADLAPAVLDSGPGGLAWPGPDFPLPATFSTTMPADPGMRFELDGPWGPLPPAEPEPEPVHTVAGRLVETSDEWLRRLVANAAPGWTYAGPVAA